MASHHALQDSSSEEKEQSDRDFEDYWTDWQLSEIDCRQVFLKVKLSFENWLKVDELLPYLKKCGLLNDKDCYMLECVGSSLEKVHQLFEMLVSKGSEVLRLLFQALMESNEVLVGQIHHEFLAKHLKETVEAIVKHETESGDEHSPHSSPLQPITTVTRDVTLTTSVASQVSTHPQPYANIQTQSLSSSLMSTDQTSEHPPPHLVETGSNLEPPALSSPPPPPSAFDPLPHPTPPLAASSSNGTLPGSPQLTVNQPSTVFPPPFESFASSSSMASLDQLRPNSPTPLLHQTSTIAPSPISSLTSSQPPIQFTAPSPTGSTVSTPSVTPPPSSSQVKPIAPPLMTSLERPTFGKSASAPTLTSLGQQTFQPQPTVAEDEPTVPSYLIPSLLPPTTSPFHSFQPTTLSPASTSMPSGSVSSASAKEGSSLQTRTSGHMVTPHFSLPFPSTQLWGSSDDKQTKKAVTAPISMAPDYRLMEQDQSVSRPVTQSQQFTPNVPAVSHGRGSEENSLSADEGGSGQRASVWASNGESISSHLMANEPPRMLASSTPLKESQSVQVEVLNYERVEELALSTPATLGIHSDREGEVESDHVEGIVFQVAQDDYKTSTQLDSEQSVINADKTESQPQLHPASDIESAVEQEDNGVKHSEELGLSQRSALTDSDNELFVSTAAEHGQWYTAGSTETEEEDKKIEREVTMEDQRRGGASDESRDDGPQEISDTEICDPEIIAAISGEDPAEGLLGLRRLIAVGRSINCPTEAGDFPIHLAVTSPWQSKEKLMILLSSHVNLNATRKSDLKTALHLACLVGRLDLVESLVENGIDVNLQDSDGFTCMHFDKTLENSQVVDYLLHYGCEPDTPSKERYLTPVTITCMCGNSTVDSLISLLEAGAAVDGHSLAPQKPLTIASRGGHLYIVRELLKHGADINIQDEDGYTALLHACSRSHYKVVEVLLQAGYGNGRNKINVNLPNQIGVSPLMLCISRGSGDLVKLLIRHNAEINCTSVCPLPDGGHLTASPMCAACVYGHIDIVMFLIDNKANINYGGDAEHSLPPIAFAAKERKTDIVKFFLKLNDLDTSLFALKNSFVSLVRFGELQCTQIIVEKCGGMERMLVDATQHSMHDVIDCIHHYREMAVESGLMLAPVSDTHEIDHKSDEVISPSEMSPKLKPSHFSPQAATQPQSQRRDQRRLIRVQRGKELRAGKGRRLHKPEEVRDSDEEEEEEEGLAPSWSERERQSAREKERLLRSRGDRAKRKKKSMKELSAEERETRISLQQAQTEHPIEQTTTSVAQGRSQEEEEGNKREGMKELGAMSDKSQLSDEEVRSKPQSLQDDQHHSRTPSAVASPLSSLGSLQQRAAVSSADTPPKKTEGGPLSVAAPTGTGRATSTSAEVTRVNREKSPAPSSGATASGAHPRPVVPLPPPSQPTSLIRATLKAPLRPPQRLRDDFVDVIQEFIQISVAAITRTKSREWLISQVEQSGYTHILKFFVDFCDASATMSRDTTLVSAFLGGDPSPLNFMLSNHLVPKGDFEAVLRDFGKTEFKDQLMLALHELPGGEELPFTGEGLVDALFGLEEQSYQTSSHQEFISGRPQTAPQFASTHSQARPPTQPQPRPHTQPQPHPPTQPQPHPPTQPQPRPHTQPQPHPPTQPHPFTSPEQRAGINSQAPSSKSSAIPSSSARPAGGHRLGYGNSQSHHSSSDLTHINQLTSSGAHSHPVPASSSTHVSASNSPSGGHRLGWGNSEASVDFQRQTSQQNQLDIEDSGARSTARTTSTEDSGVCSTTRTASTEQVGSSGTGAAPAMDDNLVEQSPYQRKESSPSESQTSTSGTSLSLGTINRLETNSSPIFHQHQTSDETPDYQDERQKPVPPSPSMQPLDSKNTSQPTKSYEKATPTHDATPTTATELATEEPIHSPIPLTTTPLPVVNTAPDSSSLSLRHGTENNMSGGLASDSKTSFTTGGAWSMEQSVDHVTLEQQQSSTSTLDNQPLMSQQEQTGSAVSAEAVPAAVVGSVGESQDGTFSVDAIVKNAQPVKSSSAVGTSTAEFENDSQEEATSTRDLENPALQTPPIAPILQTLPTLQALQIPPSTVLHHPPVSVSKTESSAAQAARKELLSSSTKSFQNVTGTRTRLEQWDSKRKHAGAKPGQQISQSDLRKQLPTARLSASSTPRKSRIPILTGSSLKSDSHVLKPRSHMLWKKKSDIKKLRFSHFDSQPETKEDDKEYKVDEHLPLRVHPTHPYTVPSTKPHISHSTMQRQKTRRTQSHTPDDSITVDKNRATRKTKKVLPPSKLKPIASSYSESGYSSVPTPKGGRRDTTTVRRQLHTDVYIQGMCFINSTVTEDAHDKIYETLSPHIRKWTIVGRYLEIDDETINRIKLSSQHNEDCCNRMLKHWVLSSPRATYTHLAKALENSMYTNLLPDLQRIMEQCSSSDIELELSLDQLEASSEVIRSLLLEQCEQGFHKAKVNIKLFK